MSQTAGPEPVAPARLRTVFCTSGGLYGALVLHRLLACERLQICAVVHSSRILDPAFGFLRGALAQIRLSGIAYSSLLFCATTLADLLCSCTRAGSVSSRSRAERIPVHTTRDVNDDAGLRFLAACAPDLLVSAFFNQRLREPALAIPKRACLNVHPSLLPDFKGVDPVLQARLHGAPLGVTVHFMTPRLDAGRILARRAVVVAPEASVLEATAILFREGADMLVADLVRVESGEIGSEQSGIGSYQSWPTRGQVRALRSTGGRLMRLADLVRLVPSRRAREHDVDALPHD